MSWSTSELRVRLAQWNWFKLSSKILYWPFQCGTSFLDHLCFLCLVFLMLSRLFIAALWSPARKVLSSWLLLVMCIVFLLLSHVMSWVRYGTWCIVSWSLPYFLPLLTIPVTTGANGGATLLHLGTTDLTPGQTGGLHRAQFIMVEARTLPASSPFTMVYIEDLTWVLMFYWIY